MVEVIDKALLHSIILPFTPTEINMEAVKLLSQTTIQLSNLLKWNFQEKHSTVYYTVASLSLSPNTGIQPENLIKIYINEFFSPNLFDCK